MCTTGQGVTATQGATKPLDVPQRAALEAQQGSPASRNQKRRRIPQSTLLTSPFTDTTAQAPLNRPTLLGT